MSKKKNMTGHRKWTKLKLDKNLVTIGMQLADIFGTMIDHGILA